MKRMFQLWKNIIQNLNNLGVDMNNNNRLNERILILGMTSFFLTLIILLTFSPAVFAQNRDEELEEQIELLYDVIEFVRDNYVDEDILTN